MTLAGYPLWRHFKLVHVCLRGLEDVSLQGEQLRICQAQ